MQYLEAGFYGFDYNDTQDGYQMVPLAATGDPEDVTAEYKEEYGLDGDEALAWKITLRDDLKWDDGTPITAADFVTSAEPFVKSEGTASSCRYALLRKSCLKECKEFPVCRTACICGSADLF